MVIIVGMLAVMFRTTPSNTATSPPNTIAHSPSEIGDVARNSQSTNSERRTTKELATERKWFTLVSSAILKNADSANGVSANLGARPDDPIIGETVFVPESMNPSDISEKQGFHVPRNWDDVKAGFDEVIAALNDDVASIQQARDGDADAAREAPKKAAATTDALCRTLARAREHYAAEGGRPNDLMEFYLSDTGDLPCDLLDDPHPTKAVVKRKTVGIEDIVEFTGYGGQLAPRNDSGAANLIHDKGIRLASGTPVTIMEHRMSPDDGVGELCRSNIPNHSKQYWLSCNDLNSIR